jgi:hypothetical protein
LFAFPRVVGLFLHSEAPGPVSHQSLQKSPTTLVFFTSHVNNLMLEAVFCVVFRFRCAVDQNVGNLSYPLTSVTLLHTPLLFLRGLRWYRRVSHWCQLD